MISFVITSIATSGPKLDVTKVNSTVDPTWGLGLSTDFFPSRSASSGIRFTITLAVSVPPFPSLIV